jgi:hypothetical protein
MHAVHMCGAGGIPAGIHTAMRASGVRRPSCCPFS